MDFTPWLAEENNLTLLADAVGLEITVDETESSVGDFNVDIYATETGKELLAEKMSDTWIKIVLDELEVYHSGRDETNT